jgi:hypothetical protein
VLFGGEFGSDEGLESGGVEGGGELAGADFLGKILSIRQFGLGGEAVQLHCH